VTNLKKYGVDNPAKNREVQAKTANTCLEKYGVTCILLNKKVQEKVIQTNLKRYGVDNPAKNREVQAKTTNTCLEKYGVKGSSQKDITNYDKWYDKEFIEKNFLDDSGFIMVKKMEKFFGVWDVTVYNKFKQLNIKCNKNTKTSHYEEEIYEFLQSIGIENIIRNDRDLISPLELDFYLPDYNFAIEFNGIYWHSVEMGKDRLYHLNKTKACEEKGVQLLQIWENEWIKNPQIFKSILKAKLHKLDKLCGARQCKIHEIDSKVGIKFQNQNHIQGKDLAKIRLGAFYDDELVSVMSFKITGSGRDKDNTCDWILSRFCSKINKNIPGIAGKLLSHFKKNYEWKGIKSLADKRISDGGLYRALGFFLSHESPPTYFYFDKKDPLKMFNKSAFQRKHIEKKWEGFKKEETEFQNMTRWGKYGKIYNSGYRTYKLLNEPK